jgi:hypothetical protein
VRCRLIAAAAVGLGLAGCVRSTVQAPPTTACVAPANAVIDAQLMFGLSIPGGGTVSPAQFDAFVAGDLTRQFPDGLTVLPGYGQWRTPEGRLVAEGARVVMVVAPDTADTAARLEAVRRAYRAQFRQRSVGLITVQSCASFEG